MIKIYYENHLREVIDMMKEPYRIITGTLLDYEWEEEEYGNFKKGYKKKDVKMDIFTSKNKYHNAVNHLYEVFEKDVLNGTPGKLYFGDCYLSCFIQGSKKKNWESDIFMTLDLIILTKENWVSETSFVFNSTGITSSNNKTYPARYGYRYANGLNASYIINPHFTDSNFKMIIYGPVVNPQINIGSNQYLVYIVLEEGEYLEIDSRTGKIEKVLQNGERVNAFHNRQKGTKFFKKIPSGRQNISFSSKMIFDLFIYEERSEPKW